MRIVVLALALVQLSGTLSAQSESSALSHSRYLEEDRIHRIEASVVDLPMGSRQPVLQLDLHRLMEIYNVPGLSFAIIDNFQIVAARAYGVIEARSTKPVTLKTLFQAGSISKSVAAAAALYLVEHGALSLDEDVNQKLTTWKVPDNDFTRSRKVTLRRLLSHTAGLTVHGFPGYDVNDSLPTLSQILNGEAPANTPPIRVDLVPGSQMRYSGGGVTIEQQLIVDVSQKPFPALMRETVLDKIGMSDSGYEQPLPPVRAALAASGTHASGETVHGKWHIYPEMAAAGLWTTPTDLAKFAIEIALSKQGRANRVLSKEMTRQMLTPVLKEAALGFFVDELNPGQFGHDGVNAGFQALLSMNAESGKGIVVMANSDNGLAVAEFLMQKAAAEYDWRYKTRGKDATGLLFLIAKVAGAQAALQRYTELKSAQPAEYEIEESTLNHLGYTLLESAQTQDAIAVFQRNTREYPQSANVYESLGEAYLKAGPKDLAIRNYEKSLQLDPKNQNAAAMLRKLQTPR